MHHIVILAGRSLSDLFFDFTKYNMCIKKTPAGARDEGWAASG